MPTHDVAIRRLLARRGPMLGTDLAVALLKTGQVATDGAARQAVRRAEVKSTRPVGFDQEHLYYLEEHFPRKYAEAVRKHLATRPPLKRSFSRLLANKGWITRGEIAKAAASRTGGTDSRGVGHVIEQLRLLKLIEPDHDLEDVFRIHRTFGLPKTSSQDFAAQIDWEQTLLSLLSDVLQRANICAWDRVGVRSTPQDFLLWKAAAWDAVSPCFVGPFASTAKGKKRARAYAVVDIVGTRQYRRDDADSLLARRDGVLARQDEQTALFCVVLAPSYARDTLPRLRSEGVLPLRLQHVLGPDAARVLAQVRTIVARSKSGDRIRPQEISKLLRQAKDMKALRGRLWNIRGELFATAVALAWSLRRYGIEREHPLHDPEENRTLPVDVVATTRTKCVMIECKGRFTDRKSTRADLERFFEDKCARAAVLWKTRPANRRAIFVTTGGLDAAAQAYAATLGRSHGFECEVWRRKTLIEFLRAAGAPHLVYVVNKYFARKSTRPPKSR